MDPDEHLLDDLLGLEAVLQEPERDGVYVALVAPHQLLEGAWVTPPAPFQEIRLRPLGVGFTWLDGPPVWMV